MQALIYRPTSHINRAFLADTDAYYIETDDKGAYAHTGLFSHIVADSLLDLMTYIHRIDGAYGMASTLYTGEISLVSFEGE